MTVPATYREFKAIALCWSQVLMPASVASAQVPSGDQACLDGSVSLPLLLKSGHRKVLDG
jgi:hypothetical protein